MRHKIDGGDWIFSGVRQGTLLREQRAAYDTGSADLEVLKLFLPKVRIGARVGVGPNFQLGFPAPAAGRGGVQWERTGKLGGILFLLAFRKGSEVESYYNGNSVKEAFAFY